MFKDELEFEKKLVNMLVEDKGWNGGILKYPDEKTLIKNWAEILYNNNRSIDRLNNYPLTDGEMKQILDKIEQLETPLNINSFINGKTVTIKRDNPDDVEHFKKEISLKIYDRDEIAAGQSVYQIAEQPQFSKKSKMLSKRRGDFMLLINGMPVIHIELKKDGIPISQATWQIEKYASEGIFSGIFSLLQIFVAMNPNDMRYFANPGPKGNFNEKFYFHWEDFNNEIVNDWEKIADQFLSIPMAHQLIGFYTVPDDTDGVLKVMRSYQYYAVSRISDVVAKTDWEIKRNDRGGYIWHTTGSGKTMTSFKAAQLIANSKDADKVIFLMDRIELGIQSLRQYKAFADEAEEIQSTDSAGDLKNKILSNNPADTLIVTSIQKMSRVVKGEIMTNDEYEKINKKRIVIIIDECHRSVFGEMLQNIRDNFINALLFGFTGTPIQKENEKKGNNTSNIFGNELHRYSISDGIRDGNVLGFDPYLVETYTEHDIRHTLALEKSKAEDDNDANSDPNKRKIYDDFMNKKPMVSYIDSSGKKVIGIEDYLSNSQYDCDKHRDAVIDDILSKWNVTSNSCKYHAILATSSIKEACLYYKRFNEKISNNMKYPYIKICCLFDESTDGEFGKDKEKWLTSMLHDYNENFGTNYTIPAYKAYKKDVSTRLAHKKPYNNIKHDDGKTIDLLIVVDQMLTGYDSIWINALYLDKELQYENIVQAFSRTNRLNGDDKPFGIIKYYRRPHTMKKAIEDAFKVYSGDKTYGIFVDKLENNLNKLNSTFKSIKELFESNEIFNFEKNPDDYEDRFKFVQLFNKFNKILDASKVQGFRWSKVVYKFPEFEYGEPQNIIEMKIDENTYNILLSRYKELFNPQDSKDEKDETPPYDINTGLVSIRGDKIDFDYMNSKFKKYKKALQDDSDDKEVARRLLNELRKSFASLSQEDQKIANIIIHDMQSGERIIDEEEGFFEILDEYKRSQKDENIKIFAERYGIPLNDLYAFVADVKDPASLNNYGRFDSLMDVTDIKKATEYIAKTQHIKISNIRVINKIREALEDFIASKCMNIK